MDGFDAVDFLNRIKSGEFDDRLTKVLQGLTKGQLHELGEVVLSELRRSERRLGQSDSGSSAAKA